MVADDFKEYNVKHVFGEIEIDEPYEDDDGEEQELMTHHWNLINGKIVDFSKGTLVDHIDFGRDLYNPTNNDKSRYNVINIK